MWCSAAATCESSSGCRPASTAATTATHSSAGFGSGRAPAARERAMSRELLRAPSLDSLYRTAAEIFAAAATDAVAARGAFRVALAGGSTPKGLYARLVEDPALRIRIPWHRVHFFFGDERHVPPDHQNSNFRMAQDAM